MTRFSDFIGLMVPSRLIIPAGSFIAGLILLVRKLPGSEVLLPLVALLLADLSSSVLNSLSDVEADKLSNANRPLAKKSITTNQAVGLASGLTAISLAASVFVNLLFAVVVLSRLVFEYFYSTLQLKRIFPMNHLLVGVTYGAVPLFAAWAFAGGGAIPVLFFFFYIVVVVMSPLKDVKDYYADAKVGIKTLLVFLGLNKTRVILPVLILAPFITLLTFSLINESNLFAPTITSIGLLLFLLAIFNQQITKITYKESVGNWFTILSTSCGVLIQLIYAFAIVV